MIKIIAVGKIKADYLINAINDYKVRLSKFTKFDIVEVSDFPGNDNAINEAIYQESLLILDKIKKEDYVVLLDVKGKSLDSLAFAKVYDQWLINSYKAIVFVIGGSNGVNQIVVDRANYRWSFSKLTFPHQLMRVLLLEQLYRCYKINSGQKYHK